jgi:hypothetical protein
MRRVDSFSTNRIERLNSIHPYDMTNNTMEYLENQFEPKTAMNMDLNNLNDMAANSVGNNSVPTQNQ